ncbi:sulfurtransferase complex subunit TusB, partial [Aeromonas sp. CPF2-S1]|nr:sulfurtransferase complex subunit TusB [Aeromonas sp. CPF2-S1]
MLHLILNSPFQSQALAEALSYLQPEDELVLMQDAVIAASAPQWSARLAGI